jgi:ATP-dependent DNA helicase RecG
MLNDEEAKTGKPLPFESLVVLATLRDGRRQTVEDLARALQRPKDESRSVVEQLVERGLVEAQGRGASRTYLLAASVYRRQGKEAEYVRQAGMTRIEQEQMVLKLAGVKGRIKRKDVMDLCHVGGTEAYAILDRLAKHGELLRNGTRRGAFYVLPGNIDPA